MCGKNTAPGNNADARVVFIPVQKRFAINEKIGMRQTIVLQNDALFLMFEEPFDKTEDSVFRPFVMVKEISKYFARPINLLY